MKIKTADLKNDALDWAVRTAQNNGNPYSDFVKERDNFTTCWNKGGPIIHKEGITVGPYHDSLGERIPNSFQAFIGWDPELLELLYKADGTTPQEAAMRCYVASKLGDEVEVPDELLC